MKVFGKIYTAIIFILLYAPIFVLIALSFNASKSTVSFDGFTFQWYRELFTSSNLMGLLLNTLILSSLLIIWEHLSLVMKLKSL